MIVLTIEFSGWTGACGSGGGIFFGILLANFSDRLKMRPGRLKAMLLLAMAVSGVGFFLFALCTASVLPVASWGTWGLYLTIFGYSLGTMFQSAYVPLLFDMASEQSWGIAPEGAMLMGMTFASNIVAFVGLLAPPASLFSWLNWTVAGGTVVAGVAMVFYLPHTLPKYDYDNGGGTPAGNSFGASINASSLLTSV